MGENFRNFPVSMQCGKIKNLPPTENFFRQINYLAISLLKTGKTVTFTKFWLKKCESNSLCNFHSVVIAFYSTFTHFSSNRSTSYLVFSLVKTLLSRNFRQINSLVDLFSLVKMLLSRNFRQINSYVDLFSLVNYRVQAKSFDIGD